MVAFRSVYLSVLASEDMQGSVCNACAFGMCKQCLNGLVELPAL